MEKSIEAVGKTIDEAIQKALSSLNMDRDSVSVEVLENPKSGFLGFGGTMARVKVTYVLEKTETIKDFIEGLVRHMGSNAVIEVAEDDEGNIRVEIKDSNAGMLIGRRGETLDAIQYITSYVINRDEEKHKRVIVDTENYRQKREESLSRLADKVARKVIKYKKNITLEPMNAYERHVIHSALQGHKEVTTFSTGSEPNRRIVVAFAPFRQRRENKK